MKLYELPRQSYFTLVSDIHAEPYFFDHVDGMYSYCLNKDKNVVHFAAWTEVYLNNKPIDKPIEMC